MVLTQSINTADKTKSELLFDAYEDFQKDKSIGQKSFINFQGYIKDKKLGFSQAQLGDVFADLGKPDKKKEILGKLEKKTPETSEEQPMKKLDEYTKEELARQGEEATMKAVQQDLNTKTQAEEKITERSDIKQSKEDLLSKYKALLDEKNVLEKQNTKLKEIVFDKTELIISPREYFRRVKLINMNKRIEKFKENKTDYPKNAVIYFMSMMKFREGGKLGAAINRGLLKANIGAFLTRSAGGINIENLKAEMKTCLERFSAKENDSKKVKLMKELIYGEIRTATNTYIDSIVQKNKI